MTIETPLPQSPDRGAQSAGWGAGDGTGSDGSDTFRIKIWWDDGETETSVYDNGMDQAIEGGNIVVHTKK